MATELTPLNKTELSQLSAAERKVQQGHDLAREGLLEIRDNRLYKAHYKTFQDYCKERWGIERRQADRMLLTATVARNIETNLSQKSQLEGVKPPSADSHAKPLAQLPPKEQAKAWVEVIKESEKTGEPITAATVEAVVERHLPPPPAPEPPDDGPPDETADEDEGLCTEALNAKITDAIKATKESWARLAELDDDEQRATIDAVLKKRQTLKQALDDGPLGPSAQERSDEESNKIEQAARRITKLFNEEMEKLTGPWFDSYGQKDNIRNQVVSTFKTAMKTLRSAKPDHVCRKCSGDGCNKCGKSGLVTTDTHQNNLDLTADPKSKA